MISVQEGWVGQTRGSVMGKELCRKGSATVVDGNAYVICCHAPKKNKTVRDAEIHVSNAS